MINIEATIKYKGYNPNNLKPQSGKMVWTNCNSCGNGRWTQYRYHKKLCGSCAKKGRILTKEHKHKISEANKGKKRSDEFRQTMRDIKKHTSTETRKKLSDAKKGKKLTEKSKKRMSAAKQGISYDEWEGYITDSPYCPQFNYSCKESNREKYDRMCFICGLPEHLNITSNGQYKKLSVHHIDMDKNQGCEGIRWKLIPVCIHCHGMVHMDLWNCRITYLLNDKT